MQGLVKVPFRPEGSRVRQGQGLHWIRGGFVQSASGIAGGLPLAMFLLPRCGEGWAPGGGPLLAGIPPGRRGAAFPFPRCGAAAGPRVGPAAPPGRGRGPRGARTCRRPPPPADAPTRPGVPERG